MHNLEPVIQNIKNLASGDRRGIENNLDSIYALKERISEMAATNTFLAKRALQYDAAVNALVSLRDRNEDDR